METAAGAAGVWGHAWRCEAVQFGLGGTEGDDKGGGGAMTVTSVLLIAGAVTLVGIVLALVGWRGRRVGDHPYCRRCGFDLFGRARGSIVCSECGAELHRGGAVVVGVRTPRWRVA